MLLGFVQRFVKSTANPIGVDFGTDTLRMAQVELGANGEHRLVAAACADVPSHVRSEPAARLEFFVETVRELLASGNFRGRKAVLALPAGSMFIQHLRMPKLDDSEMKKALPFEAAGKLPIDPGLALLRHVVAGEVHHDQEVKTEVVLMAASRELVNQLLASASKAKLDVVGMNVEPKALIDCFSHIYRRKTDADATSCFVDIGAVATRAVIARGSQVLFARVIPIGGDHFNRAVAGALKIGGDEAKVLRIKLAQEAPKTPAPARPAVPGASRATDVAAVADHTNLDDENNSFALLGAGLSAASKRDRETASGGDGGNSGATAVLEAPSVNETLNAQSESARVEHACREPLARLIDELGLCRRYYESCFPSAPVDRLIFVGGEARQTWICQNAAREMNLPAQLGDPLVRMGKTCELPPESGIDLKQPQPAWAVAIGLSMGSVGAAASPATTK